MCFSRQSNQKITNGYIILWVVHKLHPKLMLVVIPSDLCVTEELPSINDILKLHMSLHTMRTVCNHFLLCVIGKNVGKCKFRQEKSQWYCDHFWWSICSFDSKKHMGWHDVHKIEDYYWPRKCKKCHNDAESSKGSKNMDSPTKMINEDNKTALPWLLLDNGQKNLGL